MLLFYNNVTQTCVYFTTFSRQNLPRPGLPPKIPNKPKSQPTYTSQTVDAHFHNLPTQYCLVQRHARSLAVMSHQSTFVGHENCSAANHARFIIPFPIVYGSSVVILNIPRLASRTILPTPGKCNINKLQEKMMHRLTRTRYKLQEKL